jgi:MSHA pilin protein MshA
MKIQKVQKGFTLIELVVVIVLLGILGVTALAKFQDLSGDANAAAVAGVAAELSSGSSLNYATRKLGGASSGIQTSGIDCGVIATGVMAVKPGSPYSFTGTGAADGVTGFCTVSNGSTSASAAIIGID